MSSDEKSPESELLTPEEVRRVLASAIRIDDANADTTRVDQLAAAAREVGISEGALRSAVSDVLENRQPVRHTAAQVSDVARPGGWKQMIRAWPRAAWIGLSAAALGVMTAIGSRTTVGADPLDEIVALLLVVASVIIAVDRRRAGTALRFQAEIHALWIGFIAAWSATNGAGSAGHVDDLTMIWAAVAVIGTLVVGIPGVQIQPSSRRRSA